MNDELHKVLDYFCDGTINQNEMIAETRNNYYQNTMNFLYFIDYIYPIS